MFSKDNSEAIRIFLKICNSPLLPELLHVEVHDSSSSGGMSTHPIEHQEELHEDGVRYEQLSPKTHRL